MIRLRPLAVLASLALLAAPAVAQSGGEHAAAKKKARTAAQSWLNHLDANEFGASWDEAAALLQKQIPRENWIQKAERLRDTVTAISDRTLETTQYQDSLRRASGAGPFVLLKYRSTVEAGRVDEFLVTVREDTTWNVAGYQITPLRRPSARSTAVPDSSLP